MSSHWTPEAIRALGATTDVPTLGAILGVSRWRAYQMARTGEWEQIGIRIVPVGTKYRVGVTSILEILGDADPDDSGTRTGPSAISDPQTAGSEAGDTAGEPPSPLAARGTP